MNSTKKVGGERFEDSNVTIDSISIRQVSPGPVYGLNSKVLNTRHNLKHQMLIVTGYEDEYPTRRLIERLKNQTNFTLERLESEILRESGDNGTPEIIIGSGKELHTRQYYSSQLVSSYKNLKNIVKFKEDGTYYYERS